MANVFTTLANDIYAARQIVGRERIGGLRSVRINTNLAEQVAYNDDVRSAFAPEPTVNSSFSPAMTIPEGDDQTITSKTLTLDQYANVQIPWTGEDIKKVDNNAGYETIYGLQIEQAMRKLANTVEAHVMQKLKEGAGNAAGASGTTPFASDFDLIADILKLMEDRGLPPGDVTAVLNNAAINNLRKIDALWKANEAGADDLLRRGVIGDLYGALILASGQVNAHTKGDAANYDVDSVAGYAAGAKTIHVDTGTGDFKAGDIITFGADAEKYVLNADVSGDGDIDLVLNSGLVEAIADGEDVALENNYAANIIMHNSAAEAVFRAPKVPLGGDAAVEVMNVQDPVSGLIFQMALYKGYKKSMLDISVMYAAKVWNPDFVTILQG